MSGPIVLVSRSRLRKGRADEFRSHLPRGGPSLARGRPGTLTFAAYLDEPAEEVSIVHVFRDAEAFDRHLDGVAERVREASAFIEPLSLTVYGQPSAAALGQMRRAVDSPPGGSRVALTVIPTHVGGFLRDPREGA